MKLDDYRDKKALEKALDALHKLAKHLKEPVKFMHVCGSHEHTMVRWGLRSVMPENLELVAGPGCPVCVASSQEIREAIELAERGVVLCSFGDMLRDVTPYGTLAQAKARGKDVRVVYSGLDALRVAQENPDKQVVFFAVGFETTAAPTAALLKQELPDNFSVLTSHKLTPPAVELLISQGVPLKGLVAPGHVSAITGSLAWKNFPEKHGIPTVVAGFEPLDLVVALGILLKSVLEKSPGLFNEYTRVVKPQGNAKAQSIMQDVFEVKEVFWRGLGPVPDSGLFIREHLSHLDARKRFQVEFHDHQQDMPEGCRCGDVVTGRAYPDDCPLFMTSCTPSNPYGPCMVSVEGSCSIWARAGLGKGR